MTVKGTGHDLAGRCSADNSININMQRMNKILGVDKKANTITVEAGITFGDIQQELVLKHGRVAVSGQLASVGPGGFLAGGGHGPLSRQYGLGSDQVVNFVVVTPEGKLVKVSDEGESQTHTLICCSLVSCCVWMVFGFKLIPKP